MSGKEKEIETMGLLDFLKREPKQPKPELKTQEHHPDPDLVAKVRQAAERQAAQDAQWFIEHNISPTPELREQLAQRRADEGVKTVLAEHRIVQQLGSAHPWEWKNALDQHGCITHPSGIVIEKDGVNVTVRVPGRKPVTLNDECGYIEVMAILDARIGPSYANSDWKACPLNS